MIETELKFRIEDPEIIISMLRKLGAKKLDDGFERNIVYDRKGELSEEGKLLRLRSYAGKADITLKSKKIPSEKFKIREELTLNIDSFEKGNSLLEALGFSPVWRYEKKRQTWVCEGTGVTVDVMPQIGNFMEIEGDEDSIIRIAGSLGLDIIKGLKTSYRDIFKDYCKKKGIYFGDMVFSGQGGEKE